MTDETRNDAPPVAVAPAQPRQPHPDKYAARRLEIKKAKRKAHRHKINASNRPG